MSERASELISAAERASRASSGELANEGCERTSQRTSEWPSTHVPILDCFDFVTSTLSLYNVVFFAVLFHYTYIYSFQ